MPTRSGQAVASCVVLLRRTGCRVQQTVMGGVRIVGEKLVSGDGLRTSLKRELPVSPQILPGFLLLPYTFRVQCELRFASPRKTLWSISPCSATLSHAQR